MKIKRAERLATLDGEISAIIRLAGDIEVRYQGQLDQLHPLHLESGRNFLHYLALRQQDVRSLQERLADFGLSSLGRSESSVLATLLAVRHAIRSLQGARPKREKGPVSFKRGRKLMKEHTRALFGRKTKGSVARIMVTLPLDAVDDPARVRDFLKAGMNWARINCSQGSPAEWTCLVEHVRRARKATGRACGIAMDLAGPKIRTGAMVPGPPVLALKPKRDARGVVTQPAEVTLVPESADGLTGAHTSRGTGLPSPPQLPLTRELFARIHAGDRISFLDTRGKPCALEVRFGSGGSLGAVCQTTAYLESGLGVTLVTDTAEAPARGRIGTLPPRDNPLVLSMGDTLLIHKDPRPGEPAYPGSHEETARPAHVSCTLPQVLDDVAVGESVVLDDGKAHGVIRTVDEDGIEVEITQAPRGGARIRASKGINFPDSRLSLFGLTEQDKEDLRFVVANADAVNVSFVNHPDDVEDLLDELEALEGQQLGLILKIETRQGFQNLPAILLAAMEWPVVGVMIARGDLAVEVGWIGLARMQEEILAICEAAHVPVVWATQVLERLAKKGSPTRSEISDVVMAERAECVMLNKGPYMVRAIRTLDEVLRSVQGHQRKKTTLLPALTLEDPDPEEVGRAVGARQGRWERR